MSVNVSSLDREIKNLITQINSTDSVNYDQLFKTKVVLTLTNVSIALKMSERLLMLYSKSFEVEDLLFNTEALEKMSIRELAGLHEIINRKIDNYFDKMNTVLSRMNLKELESSISILIKTTESHTNLESSTHARNLAIQIAKQIGNVNGVVNTSNRKIKSTVDTLESFSNSKTNSFTEDFIDEEKNTIDVDVDATVDSVDTSGSSKTFTQVPYGNTIKDNS